MEAKETLLDFLANPMYLSHGLFALLVVLALTRLEDFELVLLLLLDVARLFLLLGTRTFPLQRINIIFI